MLKHDLLFFCNLPMVLLGLIALPASMASMRSKRGRCTQLREELVDINEDRNPQIPRMQALCSIIWTTCRRRKRSQPTELQNASAVHNYVNNLSTSTRIATRRTP